MDKENSTGTSTAMTLRGLDDAVAYRSEQQRNLGKSLADTVRAVSRGFAVQPQLNEQLAQLAESIKAEQKKWSEAFSARIILPFDRIDLNKVLVPQLNDALAQLQTQLQQFPRNVLLDIDWDAIHDQEGYTRTAVTAELPLKARDRLNST